MVVKKNMKWYILDFFNMEKVIDEDRGCQAEEEKEISSNNQSSMCGIIKFAYLCKTLYKWYCKNTMPLKLTNTQEYFHFFG